MHLKLGHEHEETLNQGTYICSFFPQYHKRVFLMNAEYFIATLKLVR